MDASITTTRGRSSRHAPTAYPESLSSAGRLRALSAPSHPTRTARIATWGHLSATAPATRLALVLG